MTTRACRLPALLGAFVAGCTSGEAAPPSRAPIAHPGPLPPAAITALRSEPVALALDSQAKRFAVVLRTDPDRRRQPIAQRFGQRTLPIALRVQAPALGQYPCSGCHLHRGLTLEARRSPDAHQDIQPVHPPGGRPGCGGCHAPEDVERLALADGGRAPLDQAYRLCQPCHSPQVAAWAGGAHGKRLDGWRGPRVVMGCAECHDPHRPATEPRVPFGAPRRYRPGREP